MKNDEILEKASCLNEKSKLALISFYLQFLKWNKFSANPSALFRRISAHTS